MICRTLSACALLALTLAGCEKVDPLAIVEQPGGGHYYIHDLVGDSEQILCIVPTDKSLCDWESADVIVHSIRQRDDISVSWNGADAVEVRVASGTIARANSTSGDGEVQIMVIEN